MTNNPREQIHVKSLARCLVQSKFSLNDSYHPHCFITHHPRCRDEEIRLMPVEKSIIPARQLLVEVPGAEAGFSDSRSVFPPSHDDRSREH